MEGGDIFSETQWTGDAGVERRLELECPVSSLGLQGPLGPRAQALIRRKILTASTLLPCRYLLGRILAGSADPEAVAAPRRLRRAADQDLGPEVPPEGVLGALLRVKRLETPAPPARRLLPP